MLNNVSILLYLLILTLAGFALLIVVSLKVRKRLQQKALSLTASQIYERAATKAQALKLGFDGLIYAVFQDSSATEMSLLAKNSQDEFIGSIRKPTLGRKRFLNTGNQEFIIEFPPTWNRSAILYSAHDGKILARCKQTSWSGAHVYEIENYGSLKSNRSNFNFQGTWEYLKDSKKIGMKQSISSLKETGTLAILPDEIPLPVRLFILSV